MERYFLFIFDGVHAEEESFLLNYFGSDETTCDEPLQSSNQFYHSSYVYFLNLKERCKKLTEWKEVNATQYITQLLSKSGDNIDEGSKIEDTYDSSSIAECINSLADLLPLPGTFVLDVIVGCNVFENFSVSDNVQFAASLHRLSKWHSAHTSWLSRKTDSNVKEWLDLTNAEEINVNSFSKLTLPFWRGSIEFKDIGISTQCYNGFELRIDSENKEMHQYLKFVFNINTSEYLLFNPVLKVTDLCCFSSVPQHLILPVAFNLCVSENSCYHSSVKLCANIKEKNDAALILRMGYSVLKEKPKPDKLLSTSRWLKIISSGNVKYPESCFPFVDKHLTLVVVPSPNSNCMSAYVVRDSTHLDAQFFFNAVSTQNRQSLLTSGTKVTDYLVPSISKTTFLSTVEEAIRLHAASGESGTCENQSSVDTSDLLTTFIQCIDSSELVKCYNNFSDVDATYYEIDPSDWAERINLLQRQIRCDEETKHKKNVFMSFSPKRSRYYVSFSGEDIKKYFEPSGEPKVNKTAEPIQSLGYNMNYNKESLEIVKQKKWPDILNCVYDDIYYNVTQQSEDNESFGNEMVKCYVPHETASTCNNHQNQPEAPVTIQAKSMTPRKRPKNNSKLETSFRQVMMKPSAGVKKKFLKTTVGQTDHVISTIIKTLGVNEASNDQSVHKKRASRKNSVPVRCSPRKKSSVEYYSSSRSLNSTNKVEKNKTIKEKTGCSLSDVLKKKLRSAIASALESNGVNIEDVIFKPCFKRLFTICQVFVQDIQGDPRKLGTSQCIQEIAEEHVKQVIKYEKKKMK